MMSLSKDQEQSIYFHLLLFSSESTKMRKRNVTFREQYLTENRVCLLETHKNKLESKFLSPLDEIQQVAVRYNSREVKKQKTSQTENETEKLLNFHSCFFLSGAAYL